MYPVRKSCISKKYLRLLISMCLFAVVFIGCSSESKQLESHETRSEMESSESDQLLMDQETLQVDSFDDALHADTEPYLLFITNENCYFCDMLDPVIAHYLRNYNQIPLHILEADEEVKDSLTACSANSKTCLTGTPGLLEVDNGTVNWAAQGTDPVNDKLKEIALSDQP